jgi:hypothetical protein
LAEAVRFELTNGWAQPKPVRLLDTPQGKTDLKLI